MYHPNHKKRRLRRKILRDPDAKKVLLKVMTHGETGTVELDGTTYTVEKINIFDRPMDDIEVESEEWSLKKAVARLFARVIKIWSGHKE